MFLGIVNKFLKQLSRRERSILYITAVVVTLSICYIYIIEPLIHHISNLDSQLEIKESEIVRGEMLLSAKEKIENEFAQIAENLRFEGTQEQLISSFLSDIERLSVSIGVHITNIKPQKAREFSFYKKTLVEIKLDAEKSKIIKFLYDLENSESLIEIERIQLNTKTQNSNILDAVILVSKTSLL